MRIEVYNSRGGQFVSKPNRWLYKDWPSAFRDVNWRRKRIRVRTFYDRHLRERVTQVLTGTGYGVRGE